jgi:nucleotide-binding universal stress UspA family protein
VAATILVPLDGSAFAETAVTPAARIARKYGDRLKLLMAHEPPVARLPVVEPTAASDFQFGRLRADYLDYLARISGGTEALDGQIDYAVVDGQAGPVIAEEASRAKPELLVMATHGRGPVSRLWIGSVADYVVRHSSLPLLLLRPQEGGAEPTVDPRFDRALVALDRSPQAEAILEPVARMATALGTELTLVHVLEPILGAAGALPPFSVAMSEATVESLRADANQYLEDQAAKLRQRGLRVSTKVLLGTGVAMTLLRYQEEQRLDFIAMTTHGAAGFRRFLVGSVADKVIRGSAKPILVLRPAADQTEGLQ